MFVCKLRGLLGQSLVQLLQQEVIFLDFQFIYIIVKLFCLFDFEFDSFKVCYCFIIGKFVEKYFLVMNMFNRYFKKGKNVYSFF